MNDAERAPGITEGLVSALCSLWGRKYSAAMLFGFYLLVAGLMFWAPYDLYSGMIESIVKAKNYVGDLAQGDDIRGAFIIMSVIAIVGGSILMTMMGRLIALGQAQIFGGGAAALAKRSAWVAWRFIEAMILLAVGYVILYLFLIITNWLYGLNSDATWQGLVAIVHTVMVIGLIGLSILAIFAVVSLTIWAACQDRRVGLLQAWRALKGLRLRLMLSLFVVLTGTALFGFLVISLADYVLPDMGVTGGLILFLGLGGTDFVTGYLWLALGGQYSRAIGIDNTPELSA